MTGMSKTHPMVYLIILNWNGKVDTLECLASVTRINYPSYKVIVTDNGSTDDSVKAIAREFPHAIILQTGANLGYAGGNNYGIAYALKHNADYIFLLNNDTVVSEDVLSQLVLSAALLPKGSVLGAKIYFFDHPEKLWFAGGRWRNESQDFEHLGHGQPDGAAFSSITEIDYVTGCALFSDASTFRNVGLLDEKFFLTYEETDWCYRARSKGYKCFLVPNAKVWHKVSASFGGANSPMVQYFMTRNRLLWAKKHASPRTRRELHQQSWRFIRQTLFPPVHLADKSVPLIKRLTWAFSTWLRTYRCNTSNLMNRAQLIGLRDYYMGRLGDCPRAIRELAIRQRQSEASRT